MFVPRHIIAAVTGAVTLFAVAGCMAMSQRELDFSHTEQSRIAEITVSPGSGDVVIRTGTVPHVRIKRVVRYHGDEPGDTYRIEGDRLVVETSCGHQCSVSYDILVPTAVSVRGANGSGDVELTDVTEVDLTVGSGRIKVQDAAGAVRVQAGSGDITVTEITGALVAQTGSGAITGRRLGGGAVQAKTGSGDIALTVETAASVQAHASSGSVHLSVPAGNYQVQVRTGSGAQHIAVPNDPTAELLLDLRTGSGDITVNQR